MHAFARFSFGFFLFALVATIALRGTAEHVFGIAGFAVSTVKYMGAGPWALWLLPILAFFAWRHPSRLREANLAFWSTIALISGYTLFKATIPVINPFWADSFFIALDYRLHGDDPWRLSHELQQWIDVDGAAMTYSGYWGAFAFSFPAFLALSDSDHARKLRYLALYGAAWIILGNVVATLFSAAGPIYADAVVGGHTFEPMIASLSNLTFPGTSVDRVQQALWEKYVLDGGLQLTGSGISAFPSMHVAVAAIWAVYICERSWIYAPVAIAFLATILFLSVFTGWHYAVDGYMSIIGVLAINLILRNFSKVSLRKTQRNIGSEIDPALA